MLTSLYISGDFRVIFVSTNVRRFVSPSQLFRACANTAFLIFSRWYKIVLILSRIYSNFSESVLIKVVDQKGKGNKNKIMCDTNIRTV